MTTLCAGAQTAVGDWIVHTSFVGDQVKNVVESNKWVYYLSGGNLFRLDKSTQENEALSRMNYMTDMGISQIYYNSDMDYLVVVYTNSNIDVILSDGSVVNMPEIKNSMMTSSKTVNDVTFAPGVMYVAADFGYVVINDKKFVVKESHIFGEKLVSVIQVGDMLLLTSANAFYYGLAGEYYERLSSFSQSESLGSNFRMFPISDSTFFRLTDGTVSVATMTLDDAGNAKFDRDRIIEDKCELVQKTRGGFLLIGKTKVGKCFTTDNDGYNPVAIEAPGEKCSCHPDGDGTIWAAGAKGLHVLGDDTNCYVPNALTMPLSFWMTYNKEKDLLYVSSPATNAFFGEDDAYPIRVNTYDGIKWTDVTPVGAPDDNKRGSYWIEFMPGDPNTYFLGSWRDGLFKVVNDEIVLTYNADNSPIMARSSAMHPITRIDRNGNIWVVQSLENPDHPVMVLPAAKSKQSSVTIDDWETPSIDGLNTMHTKTAIFLSTKNSQYDIKIFNDGDYLMPLVFWNSNGDISSRPQQEVYDKLIDQDGVPFSWLYVKCLAEDLNGVVWLGTTEGVVSFNPAQAFSSDFRVNHIKVPRNDGTGMADYLMNGIQVNSIAVDGANRKWIGTQSSGLFLVSADGTKVIKKFNTTNSPLASNTIYQVCCNPNSNSVYVTTPAGLYEYFSDSSPAEPDYSNIYAYPNPVRPEYLGDVTITGMMDNSLVKIADASGNVIRQLKSTGGMATWDCCDQYGERVKTGVYMIICSQANGSGNSTVTKVAVIR